MNVKVGNTVINTDNVFSYEYSDTFPAESDTLLVTSVSGEKIKLRGRAANALRDHLEAKELDLSEYDGGAIDHHGH